MLGGGKGSQINVNEIKMKSKKEKNILKQTKKKPQNLERKLKTKNLKIKPKGKAKKYLLDLKEITKNKQKCLQKKRTENIREPKKKPTMLKRNQSNTKKYKFFLKKP